MLIILVACLLGIYMAGNIKKESEEPQVAERDTTQEIQEDEPAEPEVAEAEPENSETETEAEPVVRVVQRDAQETSDTSEPESQEEAVVESESVVSTSSVGGSAVVANTAQSFSGELVWPLEGSVLMNYSMDQSIYFATLDQYKRNPALIISAKEGTAVAAAAAGTITEISSDAKTGETIRMDIGDGYTLIYGQLQDLKYNEGAHLDAGDVMGSVAAATKYYALEGNNLYFAMEKDGSPVDPTEYLPQ
jgi:septal ring factor EnvC (AmiA/AmiB activator)